jgi:cytochrome c peroxidase
MEFPEGNEFTKARWELGKKLFNDSILSIDKSISCGSCHFPHLAFSDSVALSPGAFKRAGTRNAPSLANIGYHPYFLREGSVPTIEMQVLVPIQEHNEFNHNIVDIAKELDQDSIYVAMSLAAYNRRPEPFVISRALANYERTFISGNSRFDQFTFQGKKKVLTTTEKKGMQLFNSDRLKCASCHSGFNFTNYAIENNGLSMQYDDPGRFRLTLDSVDFAKFKVPSLRNVELTAPYMHKGQINTLEEVIEHYNSGGKNHPQKSKLIQPLNMTDKEKAQLLAFLKTLTDYEFTTNKNWQ